MVHLRFLALGSNGIDLIDEDDGRRILLRLLEGLSKIALALACQLGHNLRTVDQEEESSRLIRNSPCNKRFACPS